MFDMYKNCALILVLFVFGLGSVCAQMVNKPAIYASTPKLSQIPEGAMADVVASPGALGESTSVATAQSGSGLQGNTGAITTTRANPAAQQVFSTGNVSLPTSGSSQFAASSRVYTLSVYGTPKCSKGLPQQTCVSRYWFRASVDANVVSSLEDQAGTIREYLFSQNGSPLTISIPSHTWSTLKPTVDRQSSFSGSFFGSGRLIPVNSTSSSTSNSASNNNSLSNSLTGGGALTVGGTGQINIEFDATEPGDDPNGKQTVYPGTLYFSISPAISVLAGAPLKDLVFQGTKIASWTWGGDFRAGFQFQGKQPISLGITGTFSARGLSSSDKGIALSLSKLFGGSN